MSILPRVYAQQGELHDVCRDSCCLTDVLLLNTGYDHLNGHAYDIGDRDRFWHVTGDPGGGIMPRASDVVDPAPFGWPAPQTGSQWIGTGDATPGFVTYEKCFCVCGPDPTDLTFNLSIRATGRTKVSIDGTKIGEVPVGAGGIVTITATVRVGPGIHCIELAMDNTRRTEPGVNVQGTVMGEGLVRYACCNSIINDEDVCKVSSITLKTDQTWTLMSGPDSNVTYPVCATIITTQYWPRPWGTPISGTNWIGGNSGGISIGRIADYTYRKCFCMREAGTVVITITAMADDQAEVWLDGIAITPVMFNYASPTSIMFIAALDSGCHCFDIIGHDLGGAITGLNAKIDLQGSNLADPSCCACPDCNNPGPRDDDGHGAAVTEATHELRSMMLAIPNPTSGATTLHYVLEKGGDVSLDVYDAAGRLVRSLESGTREAGNHQVMLDAATLSAGTYHAVLKVNGKTFSVPVSVR